ncbi:gamma carbonic anhydrase family protein [Actinopolyspora mortivallis]|uniref:Gamma carbonic anhydrase family protein n=1 Tax=Actinopolyspora mortivallis TaxID=33906 RepID=A0A2T0GYV6_ACTMO|nr:gamma carbonic anhydrase family protein [Actinopolyspora mortivallis]PRW64296.1 gamma carbonic anhydrase family protein [Actinopolyspora mortivallis]
MYTVEIDGNRPRVDSDAWVAPGVTLVGAVTLSSGVSVWYGSVVRADGDSVSVGDDSNVQDGCVLHADPGVPVRLGRHVSVGHRAVLHGCTIEDEVLVGMSATVLNGARVGEGSLVAAGTVILEGTEIPPNSLVAGVPGKVRRELSAEERELVKANAQHYLRLKEQHEEATGSGR